MLCRGFFGFAFAQKNTQRVQHDGFLLGAPYNKNLKKSHLSNVTEMEIYAEYTKIW